MYFYYLLNGKKGANPCIDSYIIRHTTEWYTSPFATPSDTSLAAYAVRYSSVFMYVLKLIFGNF